MFDKTVIEALRAALHRAAATAGAVTCLVAVGIFGVLAALLPIKIAGWLGVAAFGFAGALEALQRNGTARIGQYRQPFRHGALLEDAMRARPHWRPKVLDQFQHGGLHFNVIGFEEYEVPHGVSVPLCPRCQREAFFEYRMRFPGRVSAGASCPRCGWQLKRCKPRNELMKDATEIAGLAR